MSAEIIQFPKPLDQRAAVRRGLERYARDAYGIAHDSPLGPRVDASLDRLVDSVLSAIPDYDVRKSDLDWRD